MSAASRRPMPSARSPFARPLDVTEVRDDPLERAIEATPEECEAIARDLVIPAVRKVAAVFEIVRRPGDRFDVTGNLEADITEHCVVSLEPFETHLNRSIEISFAPEKSPSRPIAGPAAGALAPAGIEAADPPDPLIDGRIDLGAVALEFLTLARDVHPRKPGVRFTDASFGAVAEAPSAFAALNRLKDRLE